MKAEIYMESNDPVGDWYTCPHCQKTFFVVSTNFRVEDAGATRFCSSCGGSVVVESGGVVDSGEMPSGKPVTWQGHQYETGNSHTGIVELYIDGRFVRTVPIKELE